MALSVGNKVKDFTFIDQDGEQRAWPGDFPENKLALFFLRHLGCPLCKMTVDELKEAYPRFDDKGVKVAVVVQSTPKRVAQYAGQKGLPYYLVSDREKNLYRAFEVNRGGLKEFMAPSAFKATIRATLKGHMHGAFEGDELQVPASFLLSPEGEVVHAYYGKDISDFGSVEDVLAKA